MQTMVGECELKKSLLCGMEIVMGVVKGSGKIGVYVCEI